MAAAVLAALAGCAGPVPPCPAGLPPSAVVSLVDRGWHVEIGLPAEQLTGGLEVFRRIFPNARTVMFGYGKRTFFTARTDSLSEYLLGPFPGPAAIQATGLSVPAAQAYAPGDVTVLALPPGAGRRIADFVWQDIAVDAAGGPLLIGPGPYAGSLFYAARSGYSLGHTCNTWVAEALRVGGLPISADGAILSDQVMGRAKRAGACAITR